MLLEIGIFLFAHKVPSFSSLALVLNIFWLMFCLFGSLLWVVIMWLAEIFECCVLSDFEAWLVSKEDGGRDVIIGRRGRGLFSIILRNFDLVESIIHAWVPTISESLRLCFCWKLETRRLSTFFWELLGLKTTKCWRMEWICVCLRVYIWPSNVELECSHMNCDSRLLSRALAVVYNYIYLVHWCSFLWDIGL